MQRKEFAEFLNIQPLKLRDIELGKLQLTFALAHRIAWKTGVSEEWLLANQRDTPVPEDLERRMKDRTARIAVQGGREEPIDRIVRHTDDYSIRALEELSAFAQKLGCREESEVGQLLWLSKLSRDLAKSLDQYEREIADVPKDNA